MTKSIRFVGVCLTVLLGVSCQSKQKADGVAATAGTGEFQIREYQTEVLPNGLTILWFADNSLPYVSMQMLIKSGSSDDPKGQEGLADLTASLLDQGTKSRGAPQIAEELEQIGGSFGASVEPDYSMASAASLSFYKNELLNLYSDVLLRPTFPEAEFNRHRKMTLANLQKLADQPEDFSEYLFPNFLFGSHPYGHQASGTLSSVKNLSRNAAQKFYREHYTPGNAVLAVVGQFDSVWAAQVKKAFGAWGTKTPKHREIPDFPTWKGLELLIVNRGDLNQAQIHIGFKGVPRNIPEYLEVRAALKVLGESFGSRLFEEIRVKRGLTYGIHSWFDPRAKAGPMGISTFTRVEKTGETVAETLNAYRKFVQEGLSEAEVVEVKALMRGQFPRIFETPEALARQLLVLNRYGVDKNYLTNYLRNVDLMTRDSINAAIRKYFDSDNLRILVYAPKKAVEADLRKMGRLEVRDYREFLQ